MSLRPRSMTPWRCLWTVVLMAIRVASASRWQQLRPSGTAPPGRYRHSAVWRTGTGGMLIFGGHDGNNHGQYLNDLHLYLDEENRWQQLSPGGTAPIRREAHTAVWRTGTGGMLIFGGSQGGTRLNDLHLYVDKENRWQRLSPSGTAPTPRMYHTAVWRTETGGMLVFGGEGQWWSDFHNDLYLYLDKENSWQQLSPGGTAPAPRYQHSAVWRTGTGGMLVFGGNTKSGLRNDLHLYLDQENRWQQLFPGGTAPAPRFRSSAMWCSGGLLLFGGDDGPNLLNDLYLYVDQENRWQLLSPSGSAPSGRQARNAAVWRTGTGGMLVYGGWAWNIGEEDSDLNELYLYTDQAADPTETSTPRTTMTTSTSTTKTSPASSVAESGFWKPADPVEQPTSTSAAGVSYPWSPQIDQNLEDKPEDASTGLVIAVAMLSVLTCLFASLSFLCWHRSRKRPDHADDGFVEVGAGGVIPVVQAKVIGVSEPNGVV